MYPQLEGPQVVNHSMTLAPRPVLPLGEGGVLGVPGRELCSHSELVGGALRGMGWGSAHLVHPLLLLDLLWPLSGPIIPPRLLGHLVLLPGLGGGQGLVILPFQVPHVWEDQPGEEQGMLPGGRAGRRLPPSRPTPASSRPRPPTPLPDQHTDTPSHGGRPCPQPHRPAELPGDTWGLTPLVVAARARGRAGAARAAPQLVVHILPEAAASHLQGRHVRAQLAGAPCLRGSRSSGSPLGGRF